MKGLGGHPLFCSGSSAKLFSLPDRVIEVIQGHSGPLTTRFWLKFEAPGRSCFCSCGP